jgi:glutamate racemase
VTFLHDPSKAVPYIQKAEQQSSSKSVLLIATRKSLEKTELENNQYQKITQAGIYQLVRVSRAGVL